MYKDLNPHPSLVSAVEPSTAALLPLVGEAALFARP